MSTLLDIVTNGVDQITVMGKSHVMQSTIITRYYWERICEIATSPSTLMVSILDSGLNS